MKMQTVKTILLLCLLLVVISGCAGNNDGTVVKTTKLEGNKVLIQEFSGDKLLTEQEYTSLTEDSMVRNGKFVEYYQSGQIKMLAFYKMDILDSVRLTYYENGKLSGKYYKLNGKSFALQEEYNEDGVIKKSYFKAHDHCTIFRITYKDGKADSIIGVPHMNVYDKDTLRQNDTFHVLSHVVVIEGMHTELKVRLYKSGELLIDTLINKFPYGDNSHFYMFKYSPDKKGIYTYQAVTSLTNNSGINCIDTTLINIVVE